MIFHLQVGASSGSADGEVPSWAPLRDNYMLTNPKLKDWDKMQVTSTHSEKQLFLNHRPHTDKLRLGGCMLL